jgi:PhoH-like ATPase
MVKIKNGRVYLLDTNVLLHDPQAIFGFAGALVGLPAISMEQLDHFKSEVSSRGRNSREVVRLLDALRTKGSLRDGVVLEHGGALRVFFLDDWQPETFPFKIRFEDNEILATAASLKEHGYDVVFVSKDLNARVKADALGIVAQDYLKEQVSEEKFYKGWLRVPVPAVQLGKEVPDDLLTLKETYHFSANEYVIVESRHNEYHYKVFRYLANGSFKHIQDPRMPWNFKARNPQQLMALDLLLDPTIELVTLFGPAGTGKTFLTLVGALYQVMFKDMYHKILVSRPVVPLGRDIGYLPGTMEEKLHSWMLPVFDNMDLITHEARAQSHFDVLEKDFGEYRKKNKKEMGRRHEQVDFSLDELVRRDKFSMEAITYMRGRSIPFQFILIDEVQNLTPHEVKTIVSRVGEGSKMVLAGDPYQIDSPYLDFASNGLVVTSERFRGQQLFGSVFLEKSERSMLSQLANDLL